MKPDQEFVGKNVQTALKTASEELNIPQDHLKYDIISNGSSGIFGLVGVKKAKIRVHLPAQKPRRHAKPAPSTERTRSFEETSVKTLVDEAFNEPTSQVTEQPPEKAVDTGKAAEPLVDMSAPCLQEGKQALQKIISYISEEADVTVEADNNIVLYNVVGGNSGVLIGKRGQNLEAIQYIIDKIVNKNSEKRIRLQVDVEGYLKARKDNLVKLAVRLAEKTKKTGRPSTIGQISAQDRRTVHLVLKSDKEVRTQSIGDGYYRKLVIFPKKNKTNHRRKKFTEKPANGK